MTRARLQRAGFAAIACTMCCAALPGCASTPTASQRSDVSAGARSKNENEPLNKVAGVSQTVQIVAGVLPLGVVPYDNMTLPIASPDGRYIATQTGVAPTWETVLAEREATVPTATRIEIYALDMREGIQPKDRQPPA